MANLPSQLMFPDKSVPTHNANIPDVNQSGITTLPSDLLPKSSMQEDKTTLETENLTSVVSEEAMTARKLVTLLVLVVNFVSSIAIVLTNKSLYSSKGLPPTFLAGFQFLCTFSGLLILASCGVFQVKRVRLWNVLPLCVAFCSFVVFSNFSLKYNTVGTYQLIKCLSDPLMFFLQVKLYGKKFSKKVQITLVVIVAGITLNYFTDVQVNFVGGVFGLIAVVAASFYYTWVGTKQEELALSPMQLLFYQSLISACFLLIISLSYETGPLIEFWTTLLENTKLELFLVSGLLALAVNLSVFYIVRRTSVITYAVFCKLKICLVIWGSYAVFGELMTPLQAVGTAITLLGTFVYTFLKNEESSADQESRKKIYSDDERQSGNSQRKDTI